MKIEMELYDDNPRRVTSVTYRKSEGLFTQKYCHKFREGSLPTPDMAVNILLTAMPESAKD